MAQAPQDWKLYTGSRTPHGGISRLPPAPSWRPAPAPVLQERQLLDWGTPKAWPVSAQRGAKFQASPAIVEMVNAALYLRRPLLVTGRPGSGKSSLAYAVAYELALGAPLRWSVNSTSTLRDALYRYDAIGRLQDERSGGGVGADPKAIANHLGRYIRLGPLGTALLPTTRPRVLLIDEVDKSDLDLPNDLLNVFEEGEFEVPELRRLQYTGAVTVFTDDKDGQPTADVSAGQVRCAQFPLMVLTSNGERDFPAPFLRRCLRLDMPNPTGNTLADDNPDGQRLMQIIRLQFKPAEVRRAQDLIDGFLAQVKEGKLANVATDQLLNAVHMVVHGRLGGDDEAQRVLAALKQELVGPRG